MQTVVAKCHRNGPWSCTHFVVSYTYRNVTTSQRYETSTRIVYFEREDTERFLLKIVVIVPPITRESQHNFEQ